MAQSKKGLNREDAKALYADLRKAMAGKAMPGKGAATSARATAPGKKNGASNSPAAQIAQQIKAAMAKEVSEQGPSVVSRPSNVDRGRHTAISMVLLCATFKLVFALVEWAGIYSVPNAQASLVNGTSYNYAAIAQSTNRSTPGNFSKEEMRILTALDARRVELEERSRKLDERNTDLGRRDAEYATKINELRELTEKLKVDREKNEKKRGGQLDQLANVYGSMNPEEAAQLIDQLDITIALDLLSRMPEKRIGQILSLMTPDRALAVTRMLSGSTAQR